MAHDNPTPHRGAPARPRRTYTANHRPVDIALTPAMISRHGAAGAVVLRQIAHWAAFHPETSGWFEASSWDLADLTGLSPDQVRREVRKLLDDDIIEKERVITGQGEQKCRYRPTVDFRSGKPLELAPGDSATPRHGDSATPAPGDSATPTSNGEVEKKTPPPYTPQGGNDEEAGQPATLFDGNGVPTTREIARRHANQGIEAAFDRWWSDYPTGKRGPRSSALKAWAKALKQGTEPSTLTLHLSYYNAARARAKDLYGAWPALLHGTTFINTRHTDFDHEWDDGEITDLWPAPEPTRETHAQRRARLLGTR